MRRLPASGDGPLRASHRILANTLYLLAADAANKVLALGFFIIAARHLGVERFGVLSFGVAYVTTLGVVADLGLATYITREIARQPDRARDLVGDALVLRALASIIVGVAVGLSPTILSFPAATRGVVAVCSLLVLANGLFLFAAGVFQGYECNAYTALSRAVQSGLLVLGAVALSRLPPRGIYFSWLMVGAAVASAGVAYVLVSTRLVRPRFRLRPHALLAILRAALPMGTSAILVTAYYWNGSALLASLAGDRAVGVFAAPHRLALGMAVLGTAFSGAMYPHMARLHAGGPERLPGVLVRALRYMSVTAVPVAAFGVVLAPEVVRVVYGQAYGESVPVLRVLALWGCGTYYNSLLSNYFYSVNNARFATVQAAVSLVVNVVANLLLIPRFGALGAGISLAGAELVGTALLLGRASLGWAAATCRTLAADMGRCLAAALVAVLLGRCVASASAAAALAVSVVLYLALLVAVGGLTRTDMRLLRDLVVRRGEGGIH